MPLLVEAREADTQTAQHPRLSGAYLALAVKLQEAASDMTASTVGRKLGDAIQKAHKGSGKYAYYLDHQGDENDGDVIYSCSGDTMSCPYELKDNGDGVASTAMLDMDSARKVSPVVTYEDMPDDDDDDGTATMYENWRREQVYTGEIPLFERFVSKAERDQMDSGDFAGKGKSFPINKPGDIMAAVHSMGRAGSGNYGPAALKANIIRIAKKKGWTKYLPKAWQGTDAKEAKRKPPMKDCPTCDGTGTVGKGDDAKDCKTCDGSGKIYAFQKGSKESRVAVAGGLRLVESAATLETIRLVEAKADYEIKLIAPGKGSSAFYPPEVLKRDGPRVFGAGTHVYLNHATAAEEAARPEGDVRNLAGVLTTAAEYHESHAKGPGLYARMKVFADHAQTVEEKAPHVGMSIRASGVAESGKTRDGLPVLKELTGAESVDVVTRAGAGGMILTEAARAANSNQEDNGMTDAERTQLREALGATQTLLEKERRREAIAEGARILHDVEISPDAKEYVIDNVLREAVPMKDGKIDLVKFKESVNAELKRFGSAIGAGPRVIGMGAAPVVEITEAQRAAQAEREKAETEQYREAWGALLGEEADEKGNFRVAEAAFRGRAS